MGVVAAIPTDTGLEVIDLLEDASFAGRCLHERDAATQIEGMHRLARAFVDSPETILAELSQAAVELCGADSAGITMVRANGSDEAFYEWVATAGVYTGFLNATLPRNPNPCGVCLERGRPQLFRVRQAFFDLMGIEAPTVTDGILLPWEVEGTRGTVWIVAHGRAEAFDMDDVRMMRVLANFAAMGVRQQRQQRLLMEQAKTTAAAAMANDLAHRINNPLQSLTNIVYLAGEGLSGDDTKGLAGEISVHLVRLSDVVKGLLALPSVPVRSD